MNARIIQLTPEYKDKLTEYMHQKYPTFSDTYIKYDIEEALGKELHSSKSLIAVNNNNEIVGCHLNFITKALIKGKEKNVLWGHNTFLDEYYRKSIGMDFVLEIAAIKDGFGYGLTDINSKIQHLIKSNVFVNGLRFYRVFNIWAIWGIFAKAFGISQKKLCLFPPEIRLKNTTFKLCTTVDEIEIPNNGYWNKDVCEIDFIRDKEYLNKRFFLNHVNNYYTYTNKQGNCYFTIRPIIHSGIHGLQIVDFRYNQNQKEVAKDISNAIGKICKSIRAGVTLFTTSDKSFKAIYDNKRTSKSWPIAFVGGKNNISSSDSYIIVNTADSDGDFHN